MPFSLTELSFPILIFLGIYCFFLLFYIIYSLFTAMHLLKYGVASFHLYLLIVIYIGGTILLVSGSIFLLLRYDWTYSIPLDFITKLYSGGAFLKSGIGPL